MSCTLGSVSTLADFGSRPAQWQLMADSAAKAALNAVTAVYARALAPISVNAVDPGLVGSDLNGFTPRGGVQTVAACVVTHSAVFIQ